MRLDILLLDIRLLSFVQNFDNLVLSIGISLPRGVWIDLAVTSSPLLSPFKKDLHVFT